MEESQIRRVSVARSQLVISEPFWGPLAMKLKLEESKATRTFATEGKHLFINPDFAATLSHDEIVGVVCHEVMHIVQGHPFRRGDRDFTTCNMAADLAINPIILDAKMKLPEGCAFDPKFKGMSMEAIYDAIYRKPQPQQGGGGGKGEQSQSGGKKKPGSGAESPTPSTPADDGDMALPEGGCGEVWDAPQEEKQDLEEDWKQSVIQVATLAQQAGKLPAGIQQIVERMKVTKIPWQDTLRKLVQQIAARDDYSWSRPNLRYLQQGLFLPRIHSERMPAGGIWWDTSGSMDSQESRAKITGEVVGVLDECRPDRLYVIYGDAKVQRVDIFEPGDPIVFHPKGGGGTDVRPIFKWIEDNEIDPAFFIGITDLYVSGFPSKEPDFPVVWASTTDQPAPFGDIVKVGD